MKLCVGESTELNGQQIIDTFVCLRQIYAAWESNQWFKFIKNVDLFFRERIRLLLHIDTSNWTVINNAAQMAKRFYFDTKIPNMWFCFEHNMSYLIEPKTNGDS